jgi:hypothetical protein
MKINNPIKMIAIVFLGLTAMACSPFRDYEEQLVKVEIKIAKEEYKKKVDRTISTVKSASDKTSYQKLLDDMWQKEVRQSSLVYIEDIKLAAKELRKLEGIENTPANVRSLVEKRDEMLRGEVLLNVYLSKLKEKHAFIARNFDMQEKVRAEIEKSMADFLKAKVNTMADIEAATTKHPNQKNRLLTFSGQMNRFESGYQNLLEFYSGDMGRHTLDELEKSYSKYQKMGIDKGVPLQVAIDYQRMIDQLDDTYTKVLKGMSESHSVKLSIVSWDNYYDYPTEHSYQFPYVEVSYPNLQLILSRYQNEAEMSRNQVLSDGTISLATGGRMTEKEWERGDDYASVWVEDYESEYTHEYTIVVNGESTEVQESVTRDVYVKNKKNTGKSILSKPYGYFEDEVVDMATEPGMAFVGNSNYGSWQRNSGGSFVWLWLPMFSSFDLDIDGRKRRYSRSDYERYRGRQATYVPPRARNNYTGTNAYGITSTNSPISKSLSQGRQGNNSVRGAGLSSRNQGPSRGK